MTEFNNGDKVTVLGRANVFTYIGLSSEGRHVVEAENGVCFAWDQEPLKYVEPTVEEGDEFESEVGSRVLVIGVNTGSPGQSPFAEVVQREQSAPRFDMNARHYLVADLLSNYWKRV